MIPKHDFHIHTSYSDGLASPAKIVESATEKGLEAIAVTDHGPAISVGIKPGSIDQMIEDVSIVKEDAKITVLLGIEANVVDPEGNIDLDEKILEKMDIVTGGVHYLDSSRTSPESTARNYLERVMRMMGREKIDILTHPFWYHENLSSYLSREDLEKFAKVASERNVAIELNEKYQVPDERLFSVCKEEGALFSFGTDAHKVSEVGEVRWGWELVENGELDEKDIIINQLL